ncbi:hypothetical protein C1X65_02925 [Pseudomonas sp. FW305-70]|nr:hypothetical protein C1X65_02925 [Pseudomonas sp. FW305-70]
MVVNEDAGNLTPRGVLESIASKLAPTGISITDLFPRIKKPASMAGFFYLQRAPYRAAACSVR